MDMIGQQYVGVDGAAGLAGIFLKLFEVELIVFVTVKAGLAIVPTLNEM